MFGTVLVAWIGTSLDIAEHNHFFLFMAFNNTDTEVSLI